MPVVPVGEHQDLPIVADLEELLRAAVHGPDDDLGPGGHAILGPQPQFDQSRLAGMLRSEVEQDGALRRLRRPRRRQRSETERSHQNPQRLMHANPLSRLRRFLEQPPVRAPDVM